MGIQGLLPRLKSVTERIHVSQLKGKTVAIDAYCLLHRGRIRVPASLRDVRPFVVLDGGPLPNKKEEEETRAANRRENRDKARALGARESSGVHGVLSEGSPYEADAQCAYLAHRGIVDAVLTEDSDLLAYGCPHVVLKFDGTGEADQIRFSDWRTAGICLCLDGTLGCSSKCASWLGATLLKHCQASVVHLNDLPEDGLESDGFVKGAAVLESGEEDFLGRSIPAGVARGIATGKLNPFTWKPYGMSDYRQIGQRRQYSQGRDLEMMRPYQSCCRSQ
eukprot:jgi/Picre1/30376/NNA_005740.t1